MAKKKPSPVRGLTLAECTTLRQCCNTRIEAIKDLYTGRAGEEVNKANVEKVKALFLKLTGYPLD